MSLEGYDVIFLGVFWLCALGRAVLQDSSEDLCALDAAFVGCVAEFSRSKLQVTDHRELLLLIT